jgi:nitric oxide reductase activation protein
VILSLTLGCVSLLDHVSIEDTRKVIQEAKLQGFQAFCITIDEDANQYLPYLFGKENYILVKKARELPKKIIEVIFPISELNHCNFMLLSLSYYIRAM